MGNNGKQGFRHKHSLGQNFITDERLFDTLVDLSGVGENDSVLEIGPGAGGMTKVLAVRCKRVTALEIDKTLLPILKLALFGHDNVTLVQGDVMKVSLPEITKPLGDFHIVANIPYYLTTPLIAMLLNSSLPILSMSLMVQKEAADRLLAVRGDEGYCPLSIKLNRLYSAQNALDVPASMFTPPPKVDSAFLTMVKRDTPLFPVEDEALLYKVINAAFAMRRKTLLNNLINVFSLSRPKAEAWIASSEISANARGEELTIADFAALTNNFKAASR